ncbi:MAG: RraA family protein [Bacillota bacterium]|nr:RraA family protein [Bacillota bacterium]
MMEKVGLFIRENPPLIPEDLLQRANKLSTSVLADAMEGFGVMDYTIKPISPGMKVVGTALTVNCPTGASLMFHKALYSSGKGYIVTVDAKGNTRSAAFGDLMATAAIKLGVSGIVLDGVVRDLSTLRGLNLPIFAKGAVPNATSKDGPGEINGPITCGGATVNPGDLIMGDDDGVVVVPRNLIEEVIQIAEEKSKREISRLQEIDEGKIMPDWVEKKLEQLGLL